MPKRKLGYSSSTSFIISVVKSLFPIALELCKDKDHGGYFTIMDNTKGVVLGSARIGNPPIKKSTMYLNFSIEKPTRLFRNKRHWTSRQSRDSGSEQYGGAVRGKNLIFSFSGFSEIWDEALVVATAVFCNELSFQRADKVTDRKTRRAFHQLLAAFYRANREKK